MQLQGSVTLFFFSHPEVAHAQEIQYATPVFPDMVPGKQGESQRQLTEELWTGDTGTLRGAQKQARGTTWRSQPVSLLPPNTKDQENNP